MGVHSQDPILSHLVGRYWYYHTGVGGQVHVQGTGDNDYQADDAHVQGQEISHQHHGIIKYQNFVGPMKYETQTVLPASTYRLNNPAIIPDLSQKLKSDKTKDLLLTDFESKAGESAKTVSLASPSEEDTLYDYLVSDNSTQDFETTESSAPSIKISSLARVRELGPGSGRIIRARRLVRSAGAEISYCSVGRLLLLILLIYFFE